LPHGGNVALDERPRALDFFMQSSHALGSGSRVGLRALRRPRRRQA
jgi:hypothetical protein